MCVEVVVVVRTWCWYDVSVHATQPSCSELGGRSPGSQTPATPPLLPRPNSGVKPWPCACAQGALPRTKSTQHLSLNTTGMSTTRSKKRAATAGSRLSPKTAHELQNLHNPRRPPYQCTANGESQESEPWESASAPRQGWQPQADANLSVRVHFHGETP